MEALTVELGTRGWTDGSDRTPLDAAVYLDRLQVAGEIGSWSPSAWIEAVRHDIGGAFAFLRSVGPRLTERRGTVVLVTSMAGAVGVPGRSLDSAVSAGLVGLARSFAIETPEVSVACVSITLPVPPGDWTSADVEWAHETGISNTAADVRAIAEAVVGLVDAIGGPERPLTSSIEVLRVRRL